MELDFITRNFGLLEIYFFLVRLDHWGVAMINKTFLVEIKPKTIIGVITLAQILIITIIGMALYKMVCTTSNILININERGQNKVKTKVTNQTCFFVMQNDFLNRPNKISKFVILHPLRRANTKVVINKLSKDHFSEYGKPSKIATDHGIQFTSPMWS